MLNEEKIQAMTDLAVFEKHQGRKIFPVNQYFKSDSVLFSGTPLVLR